MMQQVDITPSTEIIQSWRQQIPHWATIFGELIDNAFDANARRVVIRLDARGLQITDDGVGCPDLRLMLKPGYHLPHPTTRLGRYGIGFKHAVASAGDRLNVTTVHNGAMAEATLSWELLAQSGKWEMDLEDPVPMRAPAGTVITVSQLRNKHGLRASQIKQLIDRLSESYSPAIKQGRQLVFEAYGKATTIQAVQLPELAQSRTLELEVGSKRAYLHLGLLPEGASYPYQSLTVSYGFRVIERRVRWGLGDEPTPGLVGWLDLLEGWDLSTNKERVLDDDLEALGKQIAQRCSDLIQQAVERGFSVPLQEASNDLNTALQTLQTRRPVKEKRAAPTNPTGPVLPTHTGRRRRSAKRVQPGHAFPGILKETAGIKVSLVKLGADAGLYAYQEGGIIELNLDNPHIFARRLDKEFIVTQAVHALAAHLVLDADSQLSMAIPLDGARHYERLTELAGRILSHLPLMEDAS